MRRLGMLFVLTLALGACGDDDGGGSSASADPTSIGDELGCSTFEEQDTEELYVRELFHCELDDETSRVYTFNSSSARDDWREIAEDFGIIVLDEGETWLHVEDT